MSTMLAHMAQRLVAHPRSARKVSISPRSNGVDYSLGKRNAGVVVEHADETRKVEGSNSVPRRDRPHLMIQGTESVFRVICSDTLQLTVENETVLNGDWSAAVT